MRRGSKTASMFKEAIHTVQDQYEQTEKTLNDIRGTALDRPSPRQQVSHDNAIRESLKFCSTESLTRESTFLEHLLKSLTSKNTKIVMV